MGPGCIVVEEVLLEFVPQFLHRLKGGLIQQVLVQGAPESFHLSVGLRPVGPGITVLDFQFLEHPFQGMVPSIVGRGHLRAVVSEHRLKANAVLRVEQVDALEGGEHHAEALDVPGHLGPGQTGEGIQHRHQVAALPRAHDQVPAQVMGVQVAQFPGPGFDDLPFGLLRFPAEAVQAVPLADGIDGGRRRGVVFEDQLEYGISLVVVDAPAPLLQHQLLDESQGVPAPPCE